MTLTAAEVQGLSQQQTEAVGRQIMQLEAHGRLLLRKAAAGRLLLGQLDAEDAAALAWKVHVGGAAAAEQLVQLMLAQVSICRQSDRIDGLGYLQTVIVVWSAFV
jgi:hypothetical protein